MSPDQWSYALAVRERDATLRRRLDGAVTAMVRTGTVRRILRTYGMTYLPTTPPRAASERSASHSAKRG